jgi:hypothetical protein
MKTKTFLMLIYIVLSGSGVEEIYGETKKDTVHFTALGQFTFTVPYSGYTPLIDRLGRPYVYLATKELGLVTFDISNSLSIVPIDTQTVASLGNLKVTGIAQDNNYLLVSLGDFMGTSNAGLAIFDVSDPASPVLLDRWDTAVFNNGTSSVVWQGNYAYLGAMSKGVVILDISNKQHIRYVSQIIPDTTFGDQDYTYHSRGLFISGDTLLVADDNGGLRVIDVTNRQHPVEIGKYLSSSISSVAAAFYNHVYRIGKFAFCAMDYCGFEVVDVSNPAMMTEVSWLNPWNCTNIPPPFGSWIGSNGHTNEIACSSSGDVLFFSGGDSQVLAFDPSIPAQPRIMGAWGSPDDSVGTWGTDVYGNLVALANVRTFGFPFVSNVGGLQLLNWNLVSGVENNQDENFRIRIFPNPADDQVTIEILAAGYHNCTIEIIDILGRTVLKHENDKPRSEIRIDKLKRGIYFYRVTDIKHNISVGKLIVH